jgi:hypothetical protein
MPLKLPSMPPIAPSISVSNDVSSIGTSFKSIPLPSKNVRIGAGRILSDGRNNVDGKIGNAQIDVQAVFTNNNVDMPKVVESSLPIVNADYLLTNQPVPLVFTDFSKPTRAKMLDILRANRMESQVDRLLVRKIFELIESDPAGAKLFNDSVESLKKELEFANQTADSLKVLLDARNECDKSFRMDTLTTSFAAQFEKTLNELKVSNALKVQRENYDSSNFISIVSALTSYDTNTLLAQDINFIFWLALNDAILSVKMGLSPGYLIPQNSRNNVDTAALIQVKNSYPGLKELSEIGLGNLTIDTLNGPNNFSVARIPYVSNLSALDKVAYYCGLISNEILVSVGMGITDGTSEGQRFGALNDPISVSLGAPPEGARYLGNIDSLFSTSRMDAAGNFATANTANYDYVYSTEKQTGSAKKKYLDSVFDNPINNTASVYENTLNNADVLFRDVESFLSNVLQKSNNKKSLLTKSGLFSRVIADFGLLIENLGTGNGNPTNTAIHFAIMRKLAGSITDSGSSKKNLKIVNQKILADKLKQTLPENYNEDLIAQSRIIRINHGTISDSDYSNKKEALEQEIEFLISDVKPRNLTNEKEFSNSDFISALLPSNNQINSKRNENVHELIVQIVKDIENESFDLVNSVKPYGTFLRSNRTTKYSGFDSLTIANIVYECFAIMALAFTDVYLKRSTDIKKSDLKNVNINLNSEVSLTKKKNINNNSPILSKPKLIVGYNGISDSNSIGKLEKSGRFLSALANAISNKNTDFLIKNSDVISTDNITNKNEDLGYGEKVTAADMVDVSNKVLADDEVFWNLYAVAKSIMTNIKSSASPMFRYGRIFNKTTTSTVTNLKSHEKNLLSFVNDTDLNSISFLTRLNEISLNRAKLRLHELELLSKPYDMADLPDRIYDACELLLKSKENYTLGKSLVYALPSKQLDVFLKDASLEGINPNLKAKLSRVSNFESEVIYEDLFLPSLTLRYVATEEEVRKAVDELTEDGAGSYSFETLALRIKYYDMFKGDYVNLDAALAVPLLESYLNCKLLEVCFDVSLEPQDLISDGFEWNQNLLRSTIDVLAAKLGVNNLFDHAFIVSQGRLLPRNEEQLNSKIKQETARFDSEQGQYYVNSNVNFETIAAVHNLTDSLIFKQSMVKKMVFSVDKFDGIYSTVFDQGSMRLSIKSKDKKFDVDFMDTYYISGEIS